MVLLRINQDKCAPHFLSTSYVGKKIEGAPEGKIWLEEICLILEMMVRTEKGQNDINVVYYTSNVVSEGRTELDLSSIFSSREVGEEETILKGYADSFASYRQEKAGLSKVKSQLVVPGRN